MFGREVPRNIDGAKSRGGYIVIFGGIPLIWKSWLMSAICLSTLESEYQCLSKAMTQLIALKNLIHEMADVFDLGTLKSTIACTVFEDNNGALLLATNQRITNRTKYFHVIVVIVIIINFWYGRYNRQRYRYRYNASGTLKLYVWQLVLDHAHRRRLLLALLVQKKEGEGPTSRENKRKPLPFPRILLGTPQ